MSSYIFQRRIRLFEVCVHLFHLEWTPFNLVLSLVKSNYLRFFSQLFFSLSHADPKADPGYNPFLPWLGR